MRSMPSHPSPAVVVGLALAFTLAGALAERAPALAGPDRVYTADQFSNTVSVIDPATGKLLGQIKLGDPQPENLSPLYRGQLLVHGLGFSPDHRTLAVVSIGSNAVSFIDTSTNAVKHVAYVGRSPHEAFFTPDGKEVWVTVRGEDYIAVLDGKTYAEVKRIKLANGPGMTIFSPDGKYGFVCSTFTPETFAISTATHQIVARMKQESPFCPNIAVSPDGNQVWFTLKDIGKVQVYGARPPFAPIKLLDTGPLTNHVQLVRNKNGRFAYITVGGLNQVLVYRADTFAKVATIPVGHLPHGLWPSGDGTRVYVGLENADEVAVIDTLRNRVTQTIAVGQAPQAIVYVPGAVPSGDGTENLRPLQPADTAIHLELADARGKPVTTVALFDQGITQVLQAAVTGLEPRKRYTLAVSDVDRKEPLEPLANFMANPAGAAVVNTVGPIRQVVRPSTPAPRRILVIAPVVDGKIGAVVQTQVQR
jgi:YVTN family beta-propeller protein